MRKVTEKIGLTFENAPLLRTLVGDFASVQSRSMSSVIEHTVFDALLPCNGMMRNIAENQLFGNDGNVGRALAALFDSAIAGDDSGKADPSDFLPLVQFACNQVEIYNLPVESADLKTLHFGAAQLDLLLSYLFEPNETKKNVMQPSRYYEYEAKAGAICLKAMQEQQPSFKTQDVYRLIIRNWSDIADYAITYRLLYNLVQLNAGWSAEAQDRLQLLQIMKDISEKW